MAYYLTYRDEDGPWFAQAIADGRVLCWAQSRKDAFEFATSAEASEVAQATEAWRRKNPSDEICGAVWVREDAITNNFCSRCNTAVRPEGGHRCGDCGRNI